MDKNRNFSDYELLVKILSNISQNELNNEEIVNNREDLNAAIYIVDNKLVYEVYT